MDHRTAARPKDTLTDNEWTEEMKKCKTNPYYFATTYILINGKPFETCLSEEEFNNLWNEATTAQS